MTESGGRRPRALVADDVDTMRDFVAILLERAGYVVTAVSDGREAMEAFGAEPFDLVVLDVNMPRMDGLGALRLMRETCPGIAAIITSSDPTNRSRALAAGASFVTKGGDVGFVAALEQALDAAGLGK